MNMKISNLMKLIISILICQIAGGIGAIVTYPSIKGWYESLQKPSFNPPNWIFGPVWTLLYVLMGISLFLIWKNNEKDNKSAISIFIVQLILNVVWSCLFFGLHSPFLAFLEITILWFFILFTIYKFWRIDKISSLLLVPYILWVTFASFPNFYIWKLNI